MNTALLKKILCQPTAPFQEHFLIQTAINELETAGIPYFQDPVGNILIGVANKTEYFNLLRQKTKEPLRIFIAHMDHPGFHGNKWLSKTDLDIKWHGGSPSRLIEGSSVWLATQKKTHWNHWDNPLWEGKIRKVKLNQNKTGIESALVRLSSTQLKELYPNPKSLFGGFKFRSPVWQKGSLIYTKAADDLVGSFSVLTTAKEIWKNKNSHKKHSCFLGILTRAEEVGFIGAIAHFKLGWLSQTKRPILCISLETSRTLPNAEIGKGPVIRLGDGKTVFDANALNLFTELATHALPKRYQRRIMDGGSCEGTVTTAYGYPTIGVSIPLGNYHNQNLEGGPDSKGPPHSKAPAPEFVHLKDIQGMIQLCHALLTPNLPWADPWSTQRKKLEKHFNTYKSLLKLP